MADMTASGWEPAGAVVILQKSRANGARVGRRALVQLNMRASWFGTGAVNFPSDGVPAPAPSLVGFRKAISYIIPLGPFVGAAGVGPSVVSVSDASALAAGGLGRKVLPWGCVVPSAGTAEHDNGSPYLRFLGGPPVATAAGGASPSLGNAGSFTRGLTTEIAVTTVIVTGITLTAYAIFVEGGR